MKWEQNYIAASTYLNNDNTYHNVLIKNTENVE